MRVKRIIKPALLRAKIARASWLEGSIKRRTAPTALEAGMA
jgi:hypothetical protein